MNLQMVNIAKLLSCITKSVVIHGFDFTKVLEHVLLESSMLGMHTADLHFSTAGEGLDMKTMRYVWTHWEYQPWGQLLPLQCLQCGTVQKWCLIQIRGGGYKYECRYGKCGYKGDQRQSPAYALTINHPEGGTMLPQCSRNGAWMKTVIHL
jgi:hypothetical protein